MKDDELKLFLAARAAGRPVSPIIAGALANRRELVSIEFLSNRSPVREARSAVLSNPKVWARDLSGFWLAFVGFNVGKMKLPDSNRPSVVNNFGCRCRECRVSIG
jgi:hypothetical protein